MLDPRHLAFLRVEELLIDKHFEIRAVRHLFAIGETEDALLKFVKLGTSSDQRAYVSRRKHDLIGSVRTLRLALEALRRGDRFDDPRGSAKLAALDKAIATIEQEASLLAELFSYER